MQVYFQTDAILPCICGEEIKTYSVGYGSTPYGIWCSTCKKGTIHSPYLCTGNSDSIVDLWNNYCRNKTKEHLERRSERFYRLKNLKKRYQDCVEYSWYWYDGIGRKVFIKYG